VTAEGHLVAGRYRLVRRIGTGAMGVVWLGHDERLSRPVAVKTLLLQPGLPPAEAAEAVARCLREGRIAARMHHPNAIAVFDVVDDGGVPCLVMEYLPSRSLATAIAENGPFSPAEAAGIGAQVAAALVAAHAAGVVHRDVTPGNILLGDDGSVKITDFGISRAADDVTVTKTGMIAGTPAYLAPEVALGEDPTPASDVFSLGSALYAAVEGEPPFGLAANTLGLLHAVAGGRINPPVRSGPLTDVLIALLATEPQARPTAAEAYDLLAAVGRGEVADHTPLVAVAAAPTVVEPAGGGVAGSTEVVRRPPVVVPAGPASPKRRARGPLAVVGVFVIALAAVGVWLLGGRDGVAPAEERAPANGTVHRPDTLPAGSAPVVPVRAGETEAVDRTPAQGTEEIPTATTSATIQEPPAAVPESSPPAAPPSAAPPSVTEDVPEPTTTDTSTPPPTGGEEVTTAPSTPAVED
jgi:hypothetical protein